MNLNVDGLTIYYGQSDGRQDVPCNAPVRASLATTLEVLRSLKPGSGFLGMVLDDRFCLQMALRRNGLLCIELLDTSIPAIDTCDAEREFAEQLICAAACGQDVFRVAREARSSWKHVVL